MINNVILYPYNTGSASISALKGEWPTPLRSIRLDNSRFRHPDGTLVINWGNSNEPSWYQPDGLILNSPSAVKNASNKLTAFNLMKEAGVLIPDYTTDVQEASNKEWSETVFRTKLTGHSGSGCYVSTDGISQTTLRHTKLFVEYIKKTAEYRVHVFKGEVFDVQEKKASRTVMGIDYKIRNHEGGWVFCREGVEAPAEVLRQAQLAVQALGLDFGAADIIYNKVRGTYVLEVNTAPGLTGQTLTNYVNVFQNYIQGES